MAQGRPLPETHTNGVGVRREHYDVIQRTVSLLGLPLDDSNTLVNAAMRASRSHFEVVTGLLEDFDLLRVPIKVNTVVSRVNVEDLPDLARVLGRYRIQIWALYQFWPLGPSALANRRRYEIGAAEFLSAVDGVRRVAKIRHIEAGDVDSRWHAYFMVTDKGRAYTVSRESPETFQDLGSVFDDDVLERWHSHGDAKAVTRRLEMRLSEAGGSAKTGEPQAGSGIDTTLGLAQSGRAPKASLPTVTQRRLPCHHSRI